MWGTCSSFSPLILWNFSFKPKKMWLRCGPNQPVLGLPMAGAPAWVGRMGWELGPSCHYRSSDFIVYRSHLEGPTRRLLMPYIWGEAWEFSHLMDLPMMMQMRLVWDPQPYSVLSYSLRRRLVMDGYTTLVTVSLCPQVSFLSNSYSSLADFLTNPASTQSWPSLNLGFILPLPEPLPSLLLPSSSPVIKSWLLWPAPVLFFSHLFSLIFWFFWPLSSLTCSQTELGFSLFNWIVSCSQAWFITSIVVTIFNILNCSPCEGRCAKHFTCINPWGTIIAPFSQVRKTEEQRQCITYLKSHTHPGSTWWGREYSPGHVTTLFVVRGAIGTSWETLGTAPGLEHHEHSVSSSHGPRGWGWFPSDCWGNWANKQHDFSCNHFTSLNVFCIVVSLGRWCS